MTEPITAERLSDLIGLIYDCAIDRGRWPVAMDAMRVELACHNATMDLVTLPEGEVVNRAIVNIPAEYLPIMAGAGEDVIEQWGGIVAMRTLPIDRALVMSRTNPDFERMRATNDYYRRFAVPQGLTDVVAVPLARDARAVGTLAFGRHEAAGPVGEREIAIAQLLLPHLQRVATINRLMEIEAGMRAAHAATLDALAVPVALVAADARLVHANPAASALLAAGELMRLVAGRIEAGTPVAGRGLAAALAGIVSGRMEAGAASSGAISLAVEPASGRGGGLHVVPLGTKTGRGGAVAAVFATTAVTPPAVGIAFASRLFDLTAREAEVFALAAQGHGPKQIATALTVSRNTAKTHLARLYAKLGVASQPELMTLAGSLTIPVL
jgi:DNA-binding CsgD family transcriptional regulator/PAS domain-containing protein